MRIKQDGFSIIELLAAIALVAVVTLGLATVLKISNDSNSLAANKLSEADLMNNAMVSIFTRKSCDASFKGRVLDEQGALIIDKVQDGNGADIIKNGMKLDQVNHKVESMRLYATKESWEAFNAHSFASADEVVPLNANLEIVFNRPQKEMAAETKSKTISFPISVNQARLISQCNGGDGTNYQDVLKSACLGFGGVFDSATGQCTASQDCAKVTLNAPVSQKCVKEKLKSLQSQLSTKPKSSFMMSSIKDCMASAYSTKN
ncbi:type II secretion system protein J [Bdellovibrio sp. HCB185ZH]|uniref:PulJ/GspJ family protein n=1 Tax=Bdellovibrio sp. HCB185ZH TaxID=3394235 RepID=UPI0039A4B802